MIQMHVPRTGQSHCSVWRRRSKSGRVELKNVFQVPSAVVAHGVIAGNPRTREGWFSRSVQHRQCRHTWQILSGTSLVWRG